MSERRVPVQPTIYDAFGNYLPIEQRKLMHGPGTVGWEEHDKAFDAYFQHCVEEGKDLELGVTAEEVAKRGGFTFFELEEFLGRHPTTWKQDA